MLYEELVRDFARRTVKNLQLIEESKQQGNIDAHEVTQVINSSLGIFLLPMERQLCELTALLDESGAYRDIISTANIEPYAGNRNYHLLNLIRNAFAHTNFRAEGLGTTEIKKIILWNCPNSPYDESRSDWKMEIDVASLRGLTLHVAEMIERHFDNLGRS